jgi:hypothetical protein
VAAILWAVLLALPSFAMADGEHPLTMGIDLGSHDGYRVHLYGVKSTALLVVAKEKKVGDAETATEYLTRSVIKGDAIKADFGDLGRVSMRFVPSSARPSVSCYGTRKSVVRHGLFVGSLHFRGESGYVEVSRRRAAGRLLMPLARSRCEEAPTPDHSNSSQRRKLTKFYARFRRGVGSVEFWAETNEEGRVRYAAVDETGGEQMATFRRAFVEASPQTFATDGPLSFLSVSPPYPFSGTGLIQRNANGSRSWTGTLGVSFPGDADIGLTGPEFRTFFARQW